MGLIALNNAYSTLASGINAAATTINVQTGHGARFAVVTNYTYVTLENAGGDTEICKLTGQTGDALTVVRAQDGTTARSWVPGDVIECRPCAATVVDMLSEATAAGTSAASAHISDTTAAHAASAISYAGATGLSATDVESALDELDTEKEPADANLAKVNAAKSWSAKQSFETTQKFQQLLEKATITASAPTGTFDFVTQGIQYFTSNASANWTQNFRGDSGTTLNTLVAVGEFVTVTVLATQGATPYYPSAHQIDGSAVTPKWLGGTAPTGGDANSINVYTYTIVKTADATFTLLASKSKFA